MPQIASLSTDLSGFNSFTICRILPGFPFFSAVSRRCLGCFSTCSFVGHWFLGDLLWIGLEQHDVAGRSSGNFRWGVEDMETCGCSHRFLGWLMLCGKKYVEMGFHCRDVTIHEGNSEVRVMLVLFEVFLRARDNHNPISCGA